MSHQTRVPRTTSPTPTCPPDGRRRWPQIPRTARRRLIAGIAVGAVGSAATAGVASAAPIPGRYIVTVKAGSDARAVARDADGERPERVYRSVLDGFAATLSADELARLRQDPEVDAIEADQTVSASSTQWLPDGEPWGLDRIDQRSLPLSRTYTANHDGAGVIAYVIDTGIDVSHAEFEGRAVNVFDAFGGDGSDCDGHGTHVAGTIGARTYGVAKHVALRGVRVLDCSGSGTVSGVIAGLEWVRTHSTGPAVANLSLGGGPSAALDSAVNDLVSAGVFVAVAAGNSDTDACTQSPARARGAYTTAASDRNDRKAWFSNWGPDCVDGYAPGVDIISTAPGGQTARMSGTSMASPHVAGVAALLESYAHSSPQLITASINLMATKGAISGDAHRTPNRLL